MCDALGSTPSVTKCTGRGREEREWDVVACCWKMSKWRFREEASLGQYHKPHSFYCHKSIFCQNTRVPNRKANRQEKTSHDCLEKVIEALSPWNLPLTRKHWFHSLSYGWQLGLWLADRFCHQEETPCTPNLIRRPANDFAWHIWVTCWSLDLITKSRHWIPQLTQLQPYRTTQERREVSRADKQQTFPTFT